MFFAVLPPDGTVVEHESGEAVVGCCDDALHS
jgi:hypothetical protein